jgi:hypothetical protein
LLGIHVKDALPKVIRGVPFGKGIVPFRETFQALAQAGFWGMIGVEMWGKMHAGEDPIASCSGCSPICRLPGDQKPGQPVSHAPHRYKEKRVPAGVVSRPETEQNYFRDR